VTAFGRRADEAVESLLRLLQRALSCVTPAVLIKEFAPPGQPQILTTGRTSIRLAGDQPIGLTTLIAYELTPSAAPRATAWTARVVGYAYELRSALDRMMLAFHWHPIGRSTITWPHLHVGASIAGIDLGKAHIPGGVVTLQQAVRFAIVDCGVRPLRDDWSEILTSRNEEFRLSSGRSS
jgi:hypothetical protein